MLKQINKYILEKKILLLVVVLVALFIRIYKISDTPPSLNWDEVSHGYNAYSILTSGKDEWGKYFPVIFRAYGDYKLPVYIYLTSLSELILGLSVFSVRLPSVLAGVGTCIFTYLLVLKLFESPNIEKSKLQIIAVVAAILVAVEPWSLFLSRGAFEANVALFLFTIGVYYLSKVLRKESGGISLLLSLLFFGLTVWTYNSYRIFTPLFIFSLIIFYKKEFFDVLKRYRAVSMVSIALALLFFLPMFYQLLDRSGSARYGEVRILDEGTIARINESRAGGGSRLVHNKVTYFASEFAKNYISHFSPNFLFFNGGSHYQFSVPGRGILYLLDAPLILYGLYILLSGNLLSSKTRNLLLLWLVLAPIPSSLTREAPHVLRFITALPLPMILSALGVTQLLSKSTLKSRVVRISFWIICSLLLTFSFMNYYKSYLQDYRTTYSWSWQYGYSQVTEFVRDNYNKYNKIIITKKYGEPHEFILFNLKWPSQEYINDANLTRFEQTNWFWVDSFDKFYFVNDWQVKDSSKGEYTFVLESKKEVRCPQIIEKCLLITSPGNVPEGWTKIKETTFLDGRPAFEFYENR